MSEPKKISCPNCSGIAVMEGNVITCESCDATFKFTKTGGSKVKEIGRLDSIEKRLDRLDGLLPGEEPNPTDLEPNPADLEPDPADLEPDPDSLLG